MTQEFSTVPGTLIAVPQLEDPNFLRSVVVMVEHTWEGALGLVINHPLSHECAAVVAGFGLDWPGQPEARLAKGGPVEPQSLWMLHNDGWCFDETMRVADGISVSRSREALTRMCEAEESQLRMLVGYAGWGPGQLENEISTGAWVVGETTKDLIFEWSSDEAWTRALWQMGINPAHLVEGAGTVQ